LYATPFASGASTRVPITHPLSLTVESTRSIDPVFAESGMNVDADQPLHVGGE
jgi:hypothetical protein